MSMVTLISRALNATTRLSFAEEAILSDKIEQVQLSADISLYSDPFLTFTIENGSLILAPDMKPGLSIPPLLSPGKMVKELLLSLTSK